MKYNKGKCKILHPAGYNQGAQYRLDSVWLGRSLAERVVVILLDNKPYMSQQCTTATMKSNQILDCICRGNVGTDGEMISPLYSVLDMLLLEYSVQF